MTRDFDGKAVLVTGATRGIGLATARAFLDRGAKVAINGRSADSVNRAIGALGGHERLVSAVGSVDGAESCHRLVASALEGLGRLDVLVNNAGVLEIGTVDEHDEALWDRVVGTNLKGTFFCSQAALPALRASWGSIVNLASTAGLRGYAQFAAYCASKGAVINLTRAMAAECAPDVRINCVCPTGTETEMVETFLGRPGENPESDAKRESYESGLPMKRLATAEEVAEAILFLASDAASYISGTALPVDGGKTATG